MNAGWIKLHRKIQNSPTWGALTGPGRLVLVIILMNCSYRESSVIIDGEPHRIMPGQWLTSIRKIRELAGKYITTQNIRTALASMESTRFLTSVLTRGDRRIITINNWDLYQSEKELTTVLNDGSQRSNTIQKKKEKRRNKNLMFEIEHCELADLLKARILENNPQAKVTDSQVNSWANTARLMQERDGYSLEEIKAVLEWSQADEFWSTNILSMDKMRKQWNALTVRMQQDARNPVAMPEEGHKSARQRKKEMGLIDE